MIKKIIFGLLLIAVVLVSAKLFTSLAIQNNSDVQNRSTAQFLPWQIEPTAEGSIRVFGLTLAKSTLQEAEKLYQGGAKVSLFVSPKGNHKIEAYFDKVILGGFSAKLVLVMDLSQQRQAAMFQRGTRVSNIGAGRKKVTLSGADLQTVFSTPVASIAYLTRARLDDELLRKRFGEPAQHIRESKTNTTHWLYPELGLDIALNDEGRAVMQYVPPKQFADLIAPLLQAESQL